MWDVPRFFISELPHLPKYKTVLHIRHLFKIFTSQENTCMDCVYLVQRELPFFVWWISKKLLPHIRVNAASHANLFSDKLSYGFITAFERRPGSLIWRLWAPISKVFVRCWNLDALGSRSGIPGKFWNVVLEKDGEDQLDWSCEKWRSVT